MGDRLRASCPGFQVAAHERLHEGAVVNRQELLGIDFAPGYRQLGCRAAEGRDT